MQRSAYADHYASSDYARFKQEHRSASTGPLSLIAVSQASHDFCDPPVPELVIAAAIRTDMTFRWNIGDGWTRPKRVRGGCLHVLPPDTHAQIECDGSQEMIFLALPVADLDRVMARTGMAVDDLIAGNTDYFHDVAMTGTIQAMWQTSRSSHPSSQLHIDGLMLTLLASLLKRGGNHAYRLAARLSQKQIDTVCARIEADLEDQLGIETLADLVDMSRFQFSRAFKASTGQTPHQYLIQRRVHRARELLAANRLALAEVALACGFASQSHMTDVFRGLLGMTPGQYRTHAIA